MDLNAVYLPAADASIDSDERLAQYIRHRREEKAAGSPSFVWEENVPKYHHLTGPSYVHANLMKH